MDTTPSKLTLSEELIYPIHTVYKTFVESLCELEQDEQVARKKAWLIDRMSFEKTVMQSITTEIEQFKMAILIGSCWFNGTSIDEKSFTVPYEYNQKTYQFSVTIDIYSTKVYME